MLLYHSERLDTFFLLPTLLECPIDAAIVEFPVAEDILVEGRLATAVNLALFTAKRDNAPPADPTTEVSPLVDEEEVDTAEEDDQTGFCGVIDGVLRFRNCLPLLMEAFASPTNR